MSPQSALLEQKKGPSHHLLARPTKGLLSTDSSWHIKSPLRSIHTGSIQADKGPSQGSTRPSQTAEMTSWVRSDQFRAREDRQWALSEQYGPSHTKRLPSQGNPFQLAIGLKGQRGPFKPKEDTRLRLGLVSQV